MKFTNGYWGAKKGVTMSNTSQVREVKISDNEVYLYVVPYVQDNRAIGGNMLELYISSPQKNILRMKACHFIGSAEKEPEFELYIQNCPLEVSESDNEIIIKSDETSLVIEKNPTKFTYFYKGEKITNISNKFINTLITSIKCDEQPYMRVAMDVDIGEKIYGLGERFTPFVKNGQSVDIWNEDGGTSSEIAYKNIPFYLSNRNYGLLVNSSSKVSFEICSEMVTKVQFSVPGEIIDFMVIGGDDMKDVLVNYTNLTGKPALPPAWSFGLWLTSSFTTSYDEDTVMSFVNGMKERDIPLHVFHFDCFWMKENEWCNFEWDKTMFSDVDAMLGRMKNDAKLKICVWINPYIAQKSPLFKECMNLGYFLKKPNGSVWQTDKWQSGMGIIDFTNPDAYKWYQEKLRVLLAQGVDCFKTDFGESIPTDVVYFDGSNPVSAHNYYTYLYNKCVFEITEEFKGKNEACVFARSATVGGQKFPVHWGGDCSASYVSMNESLRGGLSLCMGGFGFWSHDISGFEGTADADVYKRWSAFGLLSTHSRLHGSKTYRVPWLFGEEAVDVLRFFTKFKCSLMPYLYSNAVFTHKTGIPVMRAMVMEFPNEIPCEDLERQYMLGENILVAPVFRKNGDVDYYLPKGTWTHILSNEIINGGEWKRENHNFMSLPLLAKENSIIPFGSNENEVEYYYSSDTTLHIFQLKNNSECQIFDMNGNKVLTVTACNQNGKITIKFDGTKKNLKVLMRNVFEVQGVEFNSHKFGSIINIADDCKEISFNI